APGTDHSLAPGLPRDAGRGGLAGGAIVSPARCRRRCGSDAGPAPRCMVRSCARLADHRRPADWPGHKDRQWLYLGARRARSRPPVTALARRRRRVFWRRRSHCYRDGDRLMSNRLPHVATAALSGALFGAGLYVSQMVDPLKVLRFLDFTAIPTGGWDPSLAFVMVPAVLVMFIAVRIGNRRRAPLFDTSFHHPAEKVIDLRLLGGAAL